MMAKLQQDDLRTKNVSCYLVRFFESFVFNECRNDSKYAIRISNTWPVKPKCSDTGKKHQMHVILFEIVQF